jgi:phosphatidylinositol alpha-1,6-mannosyltransferase
MILFATQNFLPSIGGTQLYVTGLADALAARGHAVEVYCDAAGATAAKKVDGARSYAIRRFGGFRPLMRRNKARAVATRIAQGDVRAVITDTWKSLEHLPPESLARVRVVCLAHGSEFLAKPGSAKERRMIECLAKADIVAANSHFTAGLVKPHLRGKTEVRVIAPGVDPPADATSELKPRSGDGGPRLLSIARLEPRKGIDAVLRALPALAKTHPDLRYDIVGKGADRGRLAALARKLRVAGRVFLHGYISEAKKSELLGAADVFVLPNRRERDSVEGFGIVFVEAAAFGVPALAGADGGTADAVLDGETGLLVDGADDGAVRAALSRLLDESDWRRALGRAAQQRFWREFAWPAAIERFEAALSARIPA